jgi:hypothetical protein
MAGMEYRILVNLAVIFMILTTIFRKRFRQKNRGGS